MAPAETTAPASQPLPGLVRLAISPWGQVSVNGRTVGVAPPLTQLKLPPGRHVVTVLNDGAEPYTVTVQVRPGQTQVVRHAF